MKNLVLIWLIGAYVSLCNANVVELMIDSREGKVAVESANAETFHSRRYMRKHFVGGSLSNQNVAERWFTQILDHFDPTNGATWKQRYFVNDTMWNGTGPVFLMIGGEGAANGAWMSEGTWIEYAKKFGALCFLLEHRFYGKSRPTKDMSVKNLYYLSSEQALADLAYFVTAMNEELQLTNPRWISFGGSYPGTLAAWFRLKYPHLVHGSVSTSGPLHAKADFYEYLQVVSNALDVTNRKCKPAIQDALKEIVMLTQHRVGWVELTKDFQLCDPFDGTNHEDVSNFVENVIGAFEDVIQYNKDNRKFEGIKNTNVTIETLCDIMTNTEKRIDFTSSDGILNLFADLSGKISEVDSMAELRRAFHSIPEMVLQRHGQGKETSYQRLVEVNKFFLKMNNEKCFDYKYKKMIEELQNVTWSSSAGVGGRQWTYQTCTEFGWYQSSDQKGHPYTDLFPIKFLEKQCQDIFGPKYNLDLLQRGVNRTNILYGSKNIKVTNVVFVHGSFDPWHALGITESLSESATAIFIPGTAHCANMYPESPDDPPQLKMARENIAKRIEVWLNQV